MLAQTDAPLSNDDALEEPPLRPVLPETFQAVEQALTPEQRAMLDDDAIRRFIRASDGEAATAVKRIGATLAWRDAEKPGDAFCAACRADPQAHYMHIVGYCRRERPVFYSCLALAKNRVVEDNRKHMMVTFERAVRAMPQGVSQWVWVSDFHGFGMADLNPAIGKAFLSMTAQHYPERLGVFLFIGAPKMFSALWKVIAPLVDPVTKSKLRFVPYDVDDKKTRGAILRRELQRVFDEEMVGWLMREMAENRSQHARQQKSYSYEALAKLAASPEVLQGESKENVHDARGTRRFLQKLAEQPQLLAPQVAIAVSAS